MIKSPTLSVGVERRNMGKIPAEYKEEIDVTRIGGWNRSTSYPSGTELPNNTWVSITYKTLSKGIYFVSATANMKTQSTPYETQLYQRIVTELGGSELVSVASGYITAKEQQIPIGTIIKLTEPTTVYLQVNSFTGTGTQKTKVYDDNCYAIRLDVE